MLKESQINAVIARGSTPENVNQQIKNFETGFPFLKIIRPATISDGVMTFSDNEVESLVENYGKNSNDLTVLKFVPASGAASRMFKDLFGYLDNSSSMPESVTRFIDGIRSFAFYNELESIFRQSGKNIDALLDAKDYPAIVNCLLSEDGLSYGSLPKGLLKFHRYDEDSRTPMEEHLVEGALYAQSTGNRVNIHFTVSPEHLDRFRNLFEQVKDSYERQLGVNYEISFSLQKKSTDTIAVDIDNNPFIDSDGSLLFRPAGHGALLENLNDLDADIIFVKNIDNVVPDRIKESTITYKKVLGGVLLRLQSQVFTHLQKIREGGDATDIESAENFIENNLGYKFPSEHHMLPGSERKTAVINILDRPLRVCGMVKNTGEPGGGPFWVSGTDGSQSLQIAETAQVDLGDDTQKEILSSSTHFNPVDLVCGVRDWSGEKYDLLKYRDPATGFITFKSKDGRELKAQELPGLWNGAMAFWNTAFVEVPVSTFNPVKTVNDLLRSEHS